MKKTKEEKELERIRGMEKLKSAPVKSPNYTSPLNDDVIKVNGGGVPTVEPVTRIKGTTQKISTNDITPLTNIDEFKNRPRKGGKLGIAALLTALGISALPESVQASVPVQTGLRAVEEGDPLSFLMPGDAGNPDEEQLELAEDAARKAYNNSPARFGKIRASMLGK